MNKDEHTEIERSSALRQLTKPNLDEEACKVLKSFNRYYILPIGMRNSLQDGLVCKKFRRVQGAD